MKFVNERAGERTFQEVGTARAKAWRWKRAEHIWERENLCGRSIGLVKSGDGAGAGAGGAR